MSSLVAVFVLAATHVAAGTKSALYRRWRPAVLSAAAGVSIAYVFMALVPRVVGWRLALGSGGLIPGLERQMAVFAFTGFMTAFWIETADRGATGRRARAGGDDGGVRFLVGIVFFGVMNATIGYAVARPETEAIQPLWSFVIAMALYFAVNDHVRAEHHELRYRRWGRWILVAALLAGWAVGTTPGLGIPDSWLAALIAYLGGGITMIVISHQLPRTDSASDAAAFTAGAAVFTLLAMLGSVI